MLYQKQAFCLRLHHSTDNYVLSRRVGLVHSNISLFGYSQSVSLLSNKFTLMLKKQKYRSCLLSVYCKFV